MLDDLVSRPAYALYQRLLVGERHVLAAAPATPTKRDDAARELIDAGFARVREGDPALLVPVAPAVAAQTVLSRLSARIASWQDETASTVRELIQLQRDALVDGRADSRAVQELAEVVTDPSQVLSLVDGIQAGATRELLSLDSTASAGSLCQPRISSATEKPPPVWRTVFTTDFATPELSWIIDATVEGGGAVRIAATLPMKLLIADGSRALVPLDDSGSAGVILVRSPTVVRALTALFDGLWDRATPYPPERDQPGGLTPYQRHVLSLLAAGCKDEEIAARTHVSIRTVRRNIAAILDHLGVATRFAAGVQAAKRGWV
jgi:DNA-binding CsgD family transcriptional regulator